VGINGRRTLRGGLAAGATRVVGHTAVDLLLLTSAFATLSARLEPGFARTLARPSTIIGMMAVHVLLGIATIFAYAAMRRRSGAGPRIALTAGFATWAAASALWGCTVFFGLVPWTLFAARVSVSLPIGLLAALVGAREYEGAHEATRESTPAGPPSAITA
jgi:hypothetical protein